MWAGVHCGLGLRRWRRRWTIAAGVPVIEGRGGRDIAISIDTSKPAVDGRRSGGGGLHRHDHDVYALVAPVRARVGCTRKSASVCAHAWRAAYMQDNPRYGDFAAEVCEFLSARESGCLPSRPVSLAMRSCSIRGLVRKVGANLDTAEQLSALCALGAPLLSSFAKELHRRILGRGASMRRALCTWFGTGRTGRDEGCGIGALTMARRDARYLGMVSAFLQGIDS